MPSQFYTVRQIAEVLNVSYLTAFRKILVPAAFIDNMVTQAMSGNKTPPVPAEA